MVPIHNIGAKISRYVSPIQYSLFQPIPYIIYDFFCVLIGHSFVEDLELVNLMGSLGLPVSFSTSKVVSAHMILNYELFSSWLTCSSTFIHYRKRRQPTRERKKASKHHLKKQTLKSVVMQGYVSIVKIEKAMLYQ